MEYMGVKQGTFLNDLTEEDKKAIENKPKCVFEFMCIPKPSEELKE